MPSPLHGWRVFIGEVGVIVLGVLIALGAQRAVDDWQWRQTVDQAVTQIDEELRENAFGAYAGLVVAPCLEQQLSALDAGLTAARRTGELGPIEPFRPPLHRFTEDSWLNARALQVADHLKSDTVQRYSQVYFYSRDVADVQARLHQEAAELRPLRAAISPVSADEVGAYQRQAGRVRELLERTELGEALLLRTLEEQGIVLAADQKKGALIGESRRFGPCAVTPDLKRDIPVG